MQYVDPTIGGYPIPTIAAFIQLLPAGFAGRSYRSTAATIFCAVEGKGRTCIGDRTFDWEPHDIFVAPSWSAVSHEASGDAVLFSFSDRPVQKAMGLWREAEST
jgi:gentisate 1,2-dioxygenase